MQYNSKLKKMFFTARYSTTQSKSSKSFISYTFLSTKKSSHKRQEWKQPKRQSKLGNSMPLSDSAIKNYSLYYPKSP